jgi:hypothetical protein
MISGKGLTPQYQRRRSGALIGTTAEYSGVHFSVPLLEISRWSAGGGGRLSAVGGGGRTG